MAAFATLEYVLEGQKRFETYQMSFVGVLAYDFVAIPTAGAVIGILRPIARRWAGGALIGAVLGLPVGLGAFLIVFGPPPWTSRAIGFLAMGVVFCILWGALGGGIWASRHYPRSQAAREDWG